MRGVSMTWFKGLIGCATLLTIACGEEDIRSTAEGLLSGFGNAESISLLDSYNDEESASEDAGVSVQTAFDALDNLELPAPTPLSLDQSSEGRLLAYKVCEENDGNAAVTIKRGMSFTKERQGDMFGFQHAVKRISKVKRIWTKGGSTVACSENNKSADISLETLAGMSIYADFERTSTRETTIYKEGNVFRSRTRTLDIDGNRQVQFASVDMAGDNIAIRKSMTKEVYAQFEAKNKQGKVRNHQRLLSIDEAAPFEILTERSKLVGSEVISRTVETGTLIVKSQLAEGESDVNYPRVENDFVDVRWEKAAGCMPVSGVIHGKVFSDDSDTPSKTFTIVFNGADTQIDLGEIGRAPFNIGGCRLDRPATEQEVSTEAEAEKID